MPENVMLQEAIEAIRQGQRSRGRDLLTRLLRGDQNNAQYWLWMSTVVDTVNERVYCLQTVLKLDPNNQAAKRGLILLGALPADDSVTPAPLPYRKWEVETKEEPPKPTGLFNNPVVRGIGFSLLTIIVIGLIVAGIFGYNKRNTPVAALSTRTSGPPPTFTSTPTAIPNARATTSVPTVTPTFAGPPPLRLLLEATFTPTALYVATPHTVSEAYRTAQRAFLRGDWVSAEKFFKQALETDPTAADIYFYIGESLRYQNRLGEALEQFNQAIDANPGFAPAYLARARVQQVLTPRTDVRADLMKAVETDPNFAEARLARAAYWLKAGEVESALEDLDSAVTLIPDSPLLYAYRAEARLQNGQSAAALDDALRAKQLDLTLLPAYLILGRAAMAEGELETALEALETYVKYDSQNALAWATLGKIYFLTSTGEDKALEKSLATINQALELNSNLSEAYYYRSQIYLQQGEGQKAINDLLVGLAVDPQSYAINLDLGHALLLAGRYKEARDQLTHSLELAKTDAERAAAYYWRAQVIEKIGNGPSAALDWQALQKLPEEAIPQEWLLEAEEHLLGLTPSPTNTATRRPPTSTPTSRPTQTAKPTSTPKVSPSPTKTVSVPPTRSTPTPTMP
jgi:tetratricopeptide (TPR) repeat protein